MSSTTSVFLSHAAVDSKLVASFENLLSKVTGIQSSEIFCTSLEGQGVPKGENFVDRIREKVCESRVVISLITPAYLESAFCMAELGAAWALGIHRYPIVVPPASFSDINATQLGLVAVEIDNSAALHTLFEEVADHLGVELPKQGVQRRGFSEFEDAWCSLQEGVSSAERVSRQQYDECVKTRNKLEMELRDADKDIRQLEERISQLEALKDYEEVKAIRKQYSDDAEEEEFNDCIADIKALADEVGGKEVLRHAIMEHFGRDVTPDWDSWQSQFDSAIQFGVWDVDNNRLDWSSDELKELDEHLAKLTRIYEENSDADFLDKNTGKGPQDVRFWRDLL